jgi:hypothetical protein
MTAIQLDFFLSEEECRFKAMREDIKEIYTTTEKVRKKLFAENTETKECVRTLIGLFMDINERLTVIERNICNE